MNGSKNCVNNAATVQLCQVMTAHTKIISELQN